MSKINSNTYKIARVFIDHCNSKNYQIEQSEESDNLRLDVCNLRERTIVKIYYNNTVLVQGKQNSLKAEMETLKVTLDNNPQSFIGREKQERRACASRYDILLLSLREKTKKSLSTLEAGMKITESPSSAIEYRAKITRNDSSLTLTQFDNGTLLLQGKTDKLFNDSCDLIERIADPSEKEVIARFISSDEKNLEVFAAKYTPELIVLADGNVKKKMGDVYDYLKSYDQKWFIASECLCLTKIPLPEFSPLVMPASKAFEGFAKKLLIDIGLFETDHFKTKNANFSTLNDRTHLKRRAICDKEKYGDTMLKKISLCLDTNRNFMMHSDESKITKVDSQEDAEEKVDSIFKDTKEIFDYFNDLYSLLPK